MGRGGTLPFWEVGGDTLVKEDAIQLTAAVSGRTGKLYNMVAMEHKNFEIEVQFYIGDGGRHAADGLAIWVVNAEDDINEIGPVFGMRQNFQGFGVVLDTYDNSAGATNPTLRVLSNPDGEKIFNADDNGAALQVAEGPIPDVREKIAKLRITYDGGRLSAEVDYDLMDNWVNVVENVAVPLPDINGELHFALSAITGNLYDSHNVISFLTYSIESNEEVAKPADAPRDVDTPAADVGSAESMSERDIRLRREMEEREAEQQRAIYSRTGQQDEINRLDEEKKAREAEDRRREDEERRRREDDDRRRREDEDRRRREDEDRRRDDDRRREEEDRRRRDDLDRERRRDTASSAPAFDSRVISDLQSAIRSLESRLDALTRVESQGESLLRDMSRVQDRLRGLEGASGSSGTDVLSNELQKASQRVITDLTNKLRTAETNIERSTKTAGSSNSDVLSKLSTLSSSVSSLQRSVDNLKNDIQSELSQLKSSSNKRASSSGGFGFLTYLIVGLVLAGGGFAAFRLVKRNKRSRGHFG